MKEEILYSNRKYLEENVARLKERLSKEHPGSASKGFEKGDDCTAYEMANLNHKAINTQLADCQAALKRMDEGTYGICVDCKEEISEDRIVARPEASRCTSCQSKIGIRVRG